MHSHRLETIPRGHHPQAVRLLGGDRPQRFGVGTFVEAKTAQHAGAGGAVLGKPAKTPIGPPLGVGPAAWFVRSRRQPALGGWRPPWEKVPRQVCVGIHQARHHHFAAGIDLQCVPGGGEVLDAPCGTDFSNDAAVNQQRTVFNHRELTHRQPSTRSAGSAQCQQLARSPDQDPSHGAESIIARRYATLKLRCRIENPPKRNDSDAGSRSLESRLRLAYRGPQLDRRRPGGRERPSHPDSGSLGGPRQGPGDARWQAGGRPRACLPAALQTQGLSHHLQRSENRPTVYDLLGDVDQFVFPVGRLDLDSSGLLLLTNDADFAETIMNPDFKVPKTTW